MSQRFILPFFIALWSAIGIMLTLKGVGYLLTLDNSAALTIGAVALVLGQVKASLAIKKRFIKILRRLSAYSRHVPLKAIFTPGFLILIGSMMALGMIIKHAHLPNGVRGFIDLTVGSALLTGWIWAICDKGSRARC